MGRKSSDDIGRRTKKTRAKEKENRNGKYNKKHLRQIEKIIEKNKILNKKEKIEDNDKKDNDKDKN